jgi:chaperone modulatory protein CbpM
MDESRAVRYETIVVEEHLVFTLMDLCRATGADVEQVQALVGEGLLEPLGPGPDEWRFDGTAWPRARSALRLSRDFQLGPTGTALVMDLLSEIEALRSQLRRQ